MLVNLHRATRLQIDPLGPVDDHELAGTQKLACFAVEYVGKAVTVEVNDALDRLAVNVREIDGDVFVDAVIVPLIERSHLVVPGDGPVLNVAGEQGHRPLVVPLAGVTTLLRWRVFAAAGRRAPVAGVAVRLIDELQFGIVAVPGPRRTAATFPFVARIGKALI